MVVNQPPQKADPPIFATSTDDNQPAVQGTSLQGVAPPLQSLGSGVGVAGVSGSGVGVQASTDNGVALQATANGTGAALQATSATGNAIHASQTGDAQSLPDLILAETSSNSHAAVAAHNNGYGPGVWAFSQGGNAVVATNDAPGTANADAILANTSSLNHAAVAAHNTSAKSGRVPQGFGVWATSNNTAIYGQGNPAGYFHGDVQVTGDLILVNASSGDIAEDFDVEGGLANAEPGTVLVIHPSGRLAVCADPYDTRVAGVVSGAGGLRAAIILQHLQHRPDRSPIALAGKVLCKTDASFGGIAAGDLLTTSPTPGHAMKVTDRAGAVGAILGKALGPLDTGRRLIPILVSLR